MFYGVMSQALRDQASRYLNKSILQFNKGLYKDALNTLDIAEKFAHEAQALDILSTILDTIGNVLRLSGVYDKAKLRYEDALKILEKLLECSPDNILYQSNVAGILNNFGALLMDMGRNEEAEQRFEKSLQLNEKLLQKDLENISYQTDVARTLNNLGALIDRMGRLEEAKQRYKSSLQLREKLLEKYPNNISFQTDIAVTLNNLGTLLEYTGETEEAKLRLEKSLMMHEKVLESAPNNAAYQLDVARTLNNLGTLLEYMGETEEAKLRLEKSLMMHEKLLESAPNNAAYQSNIAGTLNNLGNLLRIMERKEEAKLRFERSLMIYKNLFGADPNNVLYQSDVAMSLINFGTILRDMGMVKEAKLRFEESLNIYTEPMQYLTIRTKSRAIINIIQLVLECAKRETNLSKKQEFFKDVYTTYKQYKAFFIEHELVHENRLARESGLSAHIQQLMLNAKNEMDIDKRVEEYDKCILEVKNIAESEDDDNLKKLWSSVMYYLEGRQLVNKAIKSSPPEKDLIKQAVERFKLAKDIYRQANVCYCVYTILLELESIEVLDDKAVARMKKLLNIAIENLPEELDFSVKSAFKEIGLCLDKKNMKADPEIFIKLNTCISKIDYYALREHFSYIYQNIATYLKEPFSPNVSYRNWTLAFTFDEPEKVQGKLTIKAGENILFDEPLGKRHKIYIEKHRPHLKEETITFIVENGKNVTRQIYYSDEIKCDDDHIEVHILEYDCRRSNTSGYFNIAIVQLRYDLYKESNAIKIKNDEAYLKKVTSILDVLKGKADLIVFPEFSIPFDYLPALKQYSDSTGIVIIAGSHYVTEDNLDRYRGLFDAEFGENDLLKNISPVIIPSSKIMHAEKIIGAKVERPLFFEEGMKHGTLNRIFKLRDNVTCGIMICFDFLNDELRQRITDACNIIIVPQSNPRTERFHNTGKISIDNLRGAGNKAYIMASGIFTFNGGEEIMGGDSGVILTLDKDSHEKHGDGVITSIGNVKEQFILLASLNMNFNSSRDTQMGQVPMRSELIHIFEENEIINSKKDSPQYFIDLFDKINSCVDRVKLKKLLKDNELIIKIYSPLMDKYIKNLENLSIDQIKSRCHAIVIK
ncbi:MAG: tetratricopeptide repeat protein [Candidatus Methanoperedens sp.]|nr:tetratricopeptide repeat protein [Candidatus Methanoperedens sp.]